MDDDSALSYNAWPFYELTRAYARYQDAVVATLSETDLDPTSWRIVMILKEHEWITVSEIAAQAHAKLSTMTKAIQRMEAAGLVELRTGTQDRRATEVHLSPAGRERIAPAVDATRHVFERAFAGFSPERQAQLSELLRDLSRNLR